VDEALSTLTADGAPGAVVSVSTEDVAAAVNQSKISNTRLTRLIEQRRQKLLLDKKTLRPELDYLIDNWHPLPRDVKRGLNRFFLSYLVAYNRDLLTTEPIVTGHQLAKWLVLTDTWPQLGRSLTGTPQEIEALERHAAMEPSGLERDGFKDRLHTLAPLYVDDSDLRRFIASEPRLAAVLPRLVYYGAAQPVQPTAQPVAQTASPSVTAPAAAK
jgi:hypothetical protein